MRIISKSSDYYDAALKDFGCDPEPVYKREPSHALPPDTHKVFVKSVWQHRRYHDGAVLPAPDANQRNSISWLSSVDPSVKLPAGALVRNLCVAAVGWCGKIYPMYCSVNQSQGTLELGEIHGLLTPGPIPKAVFPQVCVYRHEDPEVFPHVPGVDSFLHRGLDLTTVVDGWDGLEKSKELLGLFLKHKVPSWVWFQDGVGIPACGGTGYKTHLILNPILRDFGFQRVVPPWQALQDLEMFLRNDLVEDKTPPMPVGSDKVIAASKGFDPKTSFRKAPTKKR